MNSESTEHGRSWPRERRPQLEQLLAVYIERLNVGEEIDPHEIIDQHPDVAPHLLRELETFEALSEGADANRALGTLGDYTLRRQIGRGGMGVVYEAWQGSMDRVVALKVLPPGIAADQKAFHRFMREAKTAGQLQHQNIVGVHSTGVEEGTPWYSMEYVEGETLGQILERLREAEPEVGTPFGMKDDVAYFGNLARVFADVADGLQHAHSKGVVHRDIKPSNLILDADGHLRILDFGLAHLEDQESLTVSGDLIGTVLYMSPEQAMAKHIPLDHRTDVYSLGATLYETLTGQPPFRGKDQHDTLSQIIVRDPRPPRQLNPKVPVDLETVVLKCLRKDPGDRYGTAEALAQDLRRFVRGDPIEARPQSRWEQLARKVWRYRVKVSLALLLAFVLGIVIWQYRPEPVLTLNGERPLTSDYGLAVQPTLSSDGSWIAYASDRSGENQLDIWLQPVHGGEARRLTTHPANDLEPAFSPDGQDIVFRSYRDGGGIYVVSVNGGSPRRIATDGMRPRFSPDGEWIAYWVLGGGPSTRAGGTICMISSAGGKPSFPTPEFTGRSPVWSPAGESLLFLDRRQGSKSSDWWVYPLEQGEPKRTGVIEVLEQHDLEPSAYGIGSVRERIVPDCWLARGGEIRILFSATTSHGSSNLWTVSLSPDTFQVVGPPQAVTSGTGRESFPWSSRDGTVAFSSLQWRVDLWRVSLSAATSPGDRPEPEPLTNDSGLDFHPFLSANRQRLFFSSTRKGDADIWMKDLRNGEVVQVTDGVEDDIYPVSNSDGSEIVYEDHKAVYLQTVGERDPELLLDYAGHPFDWSPVERTVLLLPHSGTPVRSDGKPAFIAALDVDSGDLRVVLRESKYNIYDTRFSPDGKLLAFNVVPAVDRGGSRIYIARYDRSREIPFDEWILVDEMGGSDDDRQRWSPDGKTLYFVSDRNDSHAVWKRPIDPETGTPRGSPEEVYRFGGVRRSPMSLLPNYFAICIADEAIIANLGDLAGNIWIAELEEGF